MLSRLWYVSFDILNHPRTFSVMVIFKEQTLLDSFKLILRNANATSMHASALSLDRSRSFYFLSRLPSVTRFRQDGCRRLPYRKAALSGRSSAQQTSGQQD